MDWEPVSVMSGCLLPLLLAGCGGGGGGSSARPPVSAPVSSPQLVSAATPSGLTATLAEDKSAIRVGDSVNFTVTLTNNTGQPITYSPLMGCGNPVVSGVPLTIAIQASANKAVSSPADTSGGCGAIGFGPSYTVEPGKSLSAQVSLGSAFSAPGQYQASLFLDLETGSPPGGPPATVTSVGPLTVTAQ